jgi:hypothetical protein
MISYKALWAILSVYEATDPSKPLPKLWGTLTYQMSSSDSAVEPYKTSVLALMQWHELWQRKDKITEVLGMLQKCEQDITAGQTPDLAAIPLSLPDLEFHMVRNEIWKYNNNPDGSAASLIPKWILEIQNTHFAAPCENLIHYLETAAQSNSPPYEFDRTESLILPQKFPGCIYPKDSIEHAVDRLVYGHMDRFNNGSPENWLDKVVWKLFLYWNPVDGSNAYPTLPRAIIHYLSLRADSWDALHNFCLQFTARDDLIWGCIVNTLLNGPCLPPGTPVTGKFRGPREFADSECSRAITSSHWGTSRRAFVAESENRYSHSQCDASPATFICFNGRDTNGQAQNLATSLQSLFGWGNGGPPAHISP